MSAQLVATSLSGGFGGATLFSGIDLTVSPGDVIGLVGRNGAGKSTLLRLLAGETPSLTGSVDLAPRTATVGLLPQETDRRVGETVTAFITRRTGVADANEALDRATAALAVGAEGSDDEYSDALERWLALGAADLESRIAQAADAVGLSIGLNAEMSTLSGGEAARVQLVALTLSRFDILLLDEPTNDLDVAGLETLESFVTSTPTGIVVVSHDREFLARTVSKVLEIDSVQQSHRLFGGGYESYLVERATARQAAHDAYEEYVETVDSLTQRARSQRQWASKGATAARRNGSERDKFIRHSNISSSEKQAAKARQTDRIIERLDEVIEPRKEWSLQFDIAVAPPSGQVVATLAGAVLRQGEFVLGPVTVQVDRGDRIAITGNNGEGKTTLLKLLTGAASPYSGSASLGAAVVVGWVDQARELLNTEESVVDSMSAYLPKWTGAEIRTLLAKFGLRGEHALRSGSELSPGERTRAALALLQAGGANLLVLDEPTNHLDVEAIEQLEQALERYDATLLVVTHDRRFLEALRTNRHWSLQSGQLVER